MRLHKTIGKFKHENWKLRKWNLFWSFLRLNYFYRIFSIQSNQVENLGRNIFKLVQIDSNNVILFLILFHILVETLYLKLYTFHSSKLKENYNEGQPISLIEKCL